MVHRRRASALIAATAGSPLSCAALAAPPRGARLFTVHTFGDSVLDCGRYNDHGVTPGALIVRNDDRLFPEFAGRDLQSRGPARLLHRAVDGATVDDIAGQLRDVTPQGPSIALVSVGGNDLLRALSASGSSRTLNSFEARLERFIRALPVRPLLMANVYDPTFGDDRRNFLPVDAGTARSNHRWVNEIIGRLALRHGRLVDLHAHFLRGDPSWLTRTIEPSLVGASEVRRVFLQSIGFPN